MKKITTSRDENGNLTGYVEDVAATSAPGQVMRSQLFAKELASVIRDHVRSTLEPIRARLAELECRMAEVESAGLRYRGTWQKAEIYARGHAITDSGSLWICTRDGTQERPGAGDHWQLAVKSGRGS